MVRNRANSSRIVLGLALAVLGVVGISAISTYRQPAAGSDETGERTVTLTYEFTISELPMDVRELALWLPLPADDVHQKLHTYDLAGAFAPKQVVDAVYGNRYLWDTLPSVELSNKQSLTFVFTATVTRRAYRVWDHAPRSSELTPVLRQRFLAPNRLVPISGRIADEAQRVAGDTASPMRRAKLLYDHIVDSLRYDKSGEGWGRGDAVYACDIRTGNCTDFHSLFIAEARSLSIPARFIMGIPLLPDQSSGAVPGYHCWAEFYIEDIGWIPVDASEAHKNPEKREFFFGGLDAHRIAFTTGRDVELPYAVGEPLNYSIYPHVEVDGVEHPFVKTRLSFRENDPAELPRWNDA